MTTNQPILHYSSLQRVCLRPITYFNSRCLSPGCLVFCFFPLSIHMKTLDPPGGHCSVSKKACGALCLTLLRLRTQISDAQMERDVFAFLDIALLQVEQYVLPSATCVRCTVHQIAIFVCVCIIIREHLINLINCSNIGYGIGKVSCALKPLFRTCLVFTKTLSSCI